MIQIKEPVTLLLPFQYRTLKLSHRLLESLGGVSRFMLGALDAGLTLEQLTEVTGLPGEVLGRQLTFLSHHGFVLEPAEGGRPVLGARGHRILEVERLLQCDQHSIWLDAFTLRQQEVCMLAGLEPEALLVEPPAPGPYLEAVMPQRARAYWHFDEMNRMRTLLDAEALISLLATLWPGANALIYEEQDHWDYELLRVTTPEIHYLPLFFPAGELTLCTSQSGRNQAWPLASLPVLYLETRFSRDPALPWSVEVPKAKHHLIELTSHGLLGQYWREDDRPADANVLMLPTRIHGAVPDLPSVTLPVGVSAVVKAKLHRLTCSLNEDIIVARLAQAHPGKSFCNAGCNREEIAA